MGRSKEDGIWKKVKKVASTAFCRTEELRKLVISKKNPYIRTIDGALYSKDGKRLISSAAATESFVVPKRTTKISKGAISYQWKLKAVCILGNITRLPDECFQNSGIINVVLPNKLKTVGRRCFANCTDLEELNFPNTLQTLETGALEYCGFRKLKLPKSVDCIEEDALHCSVETLIFKGKVPPLLDTQKEIPYPEHGDDDGYDGDPYEWIAPGIGKVIVPKQSLKAYRKALKKRMVYEVLKGTK